MKKKPWTFLDVFLVVVWGLGGLAVGWILGTGIVVNLARQGGLAYGSPAANTIPILGLLGGLLAGVLGGLWLKVGR